MSDNNCISTISKEQMQEQNIILYTRTTRLDDNGNVQLEMHIQGTTSECLSAITQALTAVILQVSEVDGKLDPIRVAASVAGVERSLHSTLLERVKLNITNPRGDGDGNAKYQ